MNVGLHHLPGFLAQRVVSVSSPHMVFCRAQWFAKRSDDPDLTPLGQEQARLLAEVLAPELRGGGSRAVLVSSPMKRALRTTQPLAQALGQGVLVNPLMFENGGCYGMNEGEFIPGNGGSAQEIKAEFGDGYDTSMLPKEGRWNGAMGREDMSDAIARANLAAAWTMSTKALELTEGNEGGKRAAIVIVCHADFIDTYLGQLTALNADVSMLPFPFPNTRHKTQNTSAHTNVAHTTCGRLVHCTQSGAPRLREVTGMRSVVFKY